MNPVPHSSTGAAALFHRHLHQTHSLRFSHLNLIYQYIVLMIIALKIAVNFSSCKLWEEFQLDIPIAVSAMLLNLML